MHVMEVEMTAGMNGLACHTRCMPQERDDACGLVKLRSRLSSCAEATELLATCRMQLAHALLLHIELVLHPTRCLNMETLFQLEN